MQSRHLRFDIERASSAFEPDRETLWGPLLVESSRCAIHAQPFGRRCVALLAALARRPDVSPLMRQVAMAMSRSNELPGASGDD